MTNYSLTLPSKSWYPYIILGIGTLAGSTGPIFIRLAQADGVPSAVVTAFRFIIASLVLTPLILRNHTHEIRQLRRRDLLITFTAGALLSLQLTSNFESFRHTSILIAGVLVGSVPLWTALIEHFIQKVHFGRAVWPGLFLALGGGILIAFSGGSAVASISEKLLLGSVLALCGAFLGALYLIIGRSVRHRMSFLPFVWLVFTSAAITASATAIIGGLRFTGYSIDGYFWVLMATLFPQLIAHGAFNYSLGYIPATLIGMSGQMVTAISAVAAFLVFQELPAPLQIGGSMVIAAGVVLAIIGQARSKG
jgi:drug/metabolite transporter (DMT)-like permease